MWQTLQKGLSKPTNAKKVAHTACRHVHEIGRQSEGKRQSLRLGHRQATGVPTRLCGKKTCTLHKGRKAPADWTHCVIEGLMAFPVVKQELPSKSSFLSFTSQHERKFGKCREHGSRNPAWAAQQHDGHKRDLRTHGPVHTLLRATRHHEFELHSGSCGDTGHFCWCRPASLEVNTAITLPPKQGLQQGGRAGRKDAQSQGERPSRTQEPFLEKTNDQSKGATVCWARVCLDGPSARCAGLKAKSSKRSQSPVIKCPNGGVVDKCRVGPGGDSSTAPFRQPRRRTASLPRDKEISVQCEDTGVGVVCTQTTPPGDPGTPFPPKHGFQHGGRGNLPLSKPFKSHKRRVEIMVKGLQHATPTAPPSQSMSLQQVGGGYKMMRSSRAGPVPEGMLAHTQQDMLTNHTIAFR